MSRLSTKQRRARARARPLRVFFDDYEWWVARNVEEARRLQRANQGGTSSDQAPGQEWLECGLSSAIKWHDDESGVAKERTFGELMRELGRPGLLGGTDW